jgi:hypothetical protein
VVGQKYAHTFNIVNSWTVMSFATWENFSNFDKLSFQFWIERSNENLLIVGCVFGLEKKDCDSKKIGEKSNLLITCEWINKINWKNCNKKFFKITWRQAFGL